MEELKLYVELEDIRHILKKKNILKKLAKLKVKQKGEKFGTSPVGMSWDGKHITLFIPKKKKKIRIHKMLHNQ